MQSKFIQKLELFANVLIILVALLLGYFLVQKFLFPSSEPAAAEPPRMTRGTKVEFPDIDWRDNRKTLLVVLQKSCPVCTDSVPFYKKLVEQTKGKNVKLVAVLPSSREEGRKYLAENGLEIQDVRQLVPGELNVASTPTLILVDETGAVENSWIGKIPSEKENEVIENCSR